MGFQNAIGNLLQKTGIDLWGVADLDCLLDSTSAGYPLAISLVVPVTPAIMTPVWQGPTQQYACEFKRLNELLHMAAFKLEQGLKAWGHEAQMVPPGPPWDPATYKAPFQHKTAAT